MLKRISDEESVLEWLQAPASPKSRQSSIDHEQAVTAAPYGGFDLQRGDRDTNNRYGGVIQPAGGSSSDHVRQLQRDLTELGFNIVGGNGGIFGRSTEWAVREFQIYAKMAYIAQEAAPATAGTAALPARYVDRLARVSNTQRYAGPVSGVVNANTRSALQHWLANRWRCPVVIEAWNMRAGRRNSLYSENIWSHDAVTSTAPRMFARDFTRYYSFPAGRNADDLIPLGDFARYSSWSGPRSAPPNHTWSEAEMLPEHLVGVPLGRLTAAQRSTFKVIRAVSEVECIGFFDSVNAYDNAFVSLGPCHWTLGIVGRSSVSEGELCGYLAYLRHVEPAAFAQAFEFFGLQVDENWLHSGVANGRELFKNSSRKYAGWVALQQESGNFARWPLSEADGNYFKTWHWFYRFVMAGRTVDGFRRRMWDMARIRLRDIRATPWGAGAPAVPAIPVTGGGTRPATIGDVYTSERALGLILRWHIRFPAHMIDGGQAGDRLRRAFRRASIPAGAGDPSTWTDANETALIQGLRDEVAALGNAGFQQTIRYVDNWPGWAGGANPRGYRLDSTIGNLATTRNSFQFDGSRLPPAPY